MKRTRNDITLKYLKSLKWKIHKVDDNIDIADTATCDILSDITSCPLGQGIFWIDLKYNKKDYAFNNRFDTPLMFRELDDYEGNDQDIFLIENEYHELIEYIRLNKN